MLTSAPMQRVVRRDLRCSANLWSTCPVDLCGTHSAGSVMAPAPTPKASVASSIQNYLWGFILFEIIMKTSVKKPWTLCLSSLLFISISLQFRSKKKKAEKYACFYFLLTERHPISNAIDGTNNWWQSPSIQNGREYHWVTITLDLRQVGKAKTVEECLWVAELSSSNNVRGSMPCFWTRLHSVLTVFALDEVK